MVLIVKRPDLAFILMEGLAPTKIISIVLNFIESLSFTNIRLSAKLADEKKKQTHLLNTKQRELRATQGLGTPKWSDIEALAIGSDQGKARH